MTSWTNTVLYGLINYINSRPNPLYHTIFGVHCELTQKDLTLITISRPQEQSGNMRKGSDNGKDTNPEPICFTLIRKVHSVTTGILVLTRPTFSQRTVLTRQLGIIWEQQIVTVATAVNAVDGRDNFDAEGSDQLLFVNEFECAVQPGSLVCISTAIGATQGTEGGWKIVVGRLQWTDARSGSELMLEYETESKAPIRHNINLIKESHVRAGRTIHIASVSRRPPVIYLEGGEDESTGGLWHDCINK
ncbi:hypothetical protein B0H14DRAFT_2630832 [Mycena olivaceomarginata]|nr:hypothetical protein B0H14DRAFT_2630832 [Mycena olivaceomarginata]